MNVRQTPTPTSLSPRAARLVTQPGLRPLGLISPRWIFGLALGLLSLLLLSGVSHAQSRDDGAPAESLGVADTVRANAWGPAAIYANPAGMMRVHALVVGAGYSFLDGKEGHNFGASMVDSATNPDVAFGIAYNHIMTAPDGVDRDGNAVRMALATGYRGDNVQLYAGIGARWLGLDFGSLDGETEGQSVDSWSLDAGLLLEFDRKIRFAIVGQNLIDMALAETPRILGTGLSFVFGALDVSASLDFNLSDYHDSVVSTWGLGADFTVFDVVHLRAGAIRDELLDHERLTFGLGWSDNQVAIDAAYATSLSDPTEMTFAISLRWLPR